MKNNFSKKTNVFYIKLSLLDYLSQNIRSKSFINKNLTIYKYQVRVKTI